MDFQFRENHPIQILQFTGAPCIPLTIENYHKKLYTAQQEVTNNDYISNTIVEVIMNKNYIKPPDSCMPLGIISKSEDITIG